LLKEGIYYFTHNLKGDILNYKEQETLGGMTFSSLDYELKKDNSQDFINQFRKMFSQPKAFEARGVVYVWYTENPVTRLKGESNILYIGKTINSLHERNAAYANKEGSDGNWLRYAHIFKEYGTIKIVFSLQINPKEAEKKLLLQYFEDHLEFPPMNSIL
jgi:hypothetical protein